MTTIAGAATSTPSRRSTLSRIVTSSLSAGTRKTHGSGSPRPRARRARGAAHAAAADEQQRSSTASIATITAKPIHSGTAHGHGRPSNGGSRSAHVLVQVVLALARRSRSAREQRAPERPAAGRRSPVARITALRVKPEPNWAWAPPPADRYSRRRRCAAAAWPSPYGFSAATHLRVRGVVGEQSVGLGEDHVGVGADEAQRAGIDALRPLGLLARDEHGLAERRAPLPGCRRSR